jgi:hypothetical protein
MKKPTAAAKASNKATEKKLKQPIKQALKASKGKLPATRAEALAARNMAVYDLQRAEQRIADLTAQLGAAKTAANIARYTKSVLTKALNDKTLV